MALQKYIPCCDAPSATMKAFGFSSKVQENAQLTDPANPVTSHKDVPEVDIDLREIYFLIMHFLLAGPCHRTYEQLGTQLLERQLLVRRYLAWYSRTGVCSGDENDDDVSFRYLTLSWLRASVLPMEEIVCWAHDAGAKVLVDACQSVPHMMVDVQSLETDFLVAPSHKMCGPTGIGFLYGKANHLSSMPPFLGGGEMISDVYLDYSTYAEPPSRFEAGTPAIGEAIGLEAAIDYLSGIGMNNIHDYEMELANYLYENLCSVPDVRIYGPKPSDKVQRVALCSFNVENIHPTDIATFLDQQHGVAIRSGHHCAQPLHRYLGVNASARASLHFYNTKEDVDNFIEALRDTVSFFSSYR